MKRFFCLAFSVFLFLAPLAAQEAAPETAAETPAGEALPETPAAADAADAENGGPAENMANGTAEEPSPAAGEESPPPEPEEPPKPRFPNNISHVIDDDVIFETDPADSAAAGDLYTIVRDGEELGILLVNETTETLAVARVLSIGVYPVVGDTVRKTAGAGIEATFYGGSFLKENYLKSYIPMAGIRLVLSRGFFYTRPVLEFEYLRARVHPDLPVSGALPFSALAGAEITNLYFGRFQLASVMLAGMSWAYMGNEARDLFDAGGAFKKSHISGKAFLSLSFLAARHFKITAAAGLLVLVDTWQDLSDIEPGFFGRQAAPFVTFGLTLK